jgi:hypothetical protein
VQDILTYLAPIILRAVITALVAVPLGFAIYNFMYYRYTNRNEIKNLVLEYLQLCNQNYDLSVSSWSREVLVDNNQIETVTNYLFYPTTKAIMKWVHCNLEVQKGIKKGLKYDEYFFDTIMGELMMDGRVSGITDKNTGEFIAYKFISNNI